MIAPVKPGNIFRHQQMDWSKQQIEKIRRRDNLLKEKYKSQRQREIEKLAIQENNVRLIKKVFVDLYEKTYIQTDLIS